MGPATERRARAFRAFRFTAPERNAIYDHAARQAASAAEQIRRCAQGDPSGAADAAWAAADTLHVAARALRSPALRRAADASDRAVRAPHDRLPRQTRDGGRLRAMARLVAMLGNVSGDGTLASIALIANLVALAAAVAELRQAQQHAARAAAARRAAEHLQAAATQARSAGRPGPFRVIRRPGARDAAGAGHGDFPAGLSPAMPVPARRGQVTAAPDPGIARRLPSMRGQSGDGGQGSVPRFREAAGVLDGPGT